MPLPLVSPPGFTPAGTPARFAALAAVLGLLAAPLALADEPGAAPHGPAAAEAPEATRLPPDKATKHSLDLGDRTLAFTATAGTITLTANDGGPEADMTFVAYARDGADPATRPVTFAINGGPGAASAYLDIGVLGPWILPFDGARIVPSAAPALAPNPDTWLDFTDLVFIDPVGTGFSRLVEPDDAMRDRYLSVDGDVAAISDFIVRWLVENGRTGSPKYFVGESYGGFRGPLVAEHLQTEEGVALSGMTLISPVLDFGWWQQPDYAPLPMVALLPSLAAAGMEAGAGITPEGLEAAEAYASGDFVTDLLRGVRDPAAVGRVVDRVTALTGLDRATVARAAGRVDAGDFLREIRRDEGRRASPYDPAVASEDPDPGGGRGADPVLDALTAPLTSAMLGLYRDELGWQPDRRYMLLNGGLSRAWSWGDERGQPEAVEPLRHALALDGDFRVLVAHGLTDLVTPYFASTLILRQLPAMGDAARVRQANYPGGHMFYLREGSRRAFRADAAAMYAGEAG
ncbi:MAG: peptidase S10 [Amaricoccus sp.]